MKNISKLLLLLILWSCSAEKKENDFQVLELGANLTALIDSTKTWNDFASSVEVIPLETNDSVLLATFKIVNVIGDKIVGINRVENKTAEGWIILSGMKSDVRIFDTKGKQLQLIDRKGKGGQEYNDLDALLVEEQPLTVKVMNDKKLLTYDEAGKFIRNDSLAKNYFQVVSLGKGRFIAENTLFPIPDYKYLLSVVDGEGRPVREVVPVKQDTASIAKLNFTYFGVLNMISGGALYKHPSCDTVFYITSDINVSPWGIIKAGDYGSEKAFRKFSGVETFTRTMEQAISIGQINPFRDKFFVGYYFDDKIYSEIWEMGGKKPLVRKIATYDNAGLPFKFDNGETINIRPQLIKDDKAYFIVDAYKAMNYVSGVTEDSNPVLIIAHLK